MKKFKLQLQDINGEVEEETELVLGENDILIMQYPNTYKARDVVKMYEYFSKSVEQGGVVAMPESIKFKVIKFQ